MPLILRSLKLLLTGSLAFFSMTSCGLLIEGGAAMYKESKVILCGTTVEGETYTVKGPENGLYLMRRDRSKDGISIGDSAGGFEGFHYAVFRTDSPAGEPPSAALLRHFGKNTPRDGWRVVATRKGVAEGSVGQVDLHTPRGRGFVGVAECFRRGSHLWVVARMEPMFGSGDAEVARMLESSQSSLERFAASFRWK